MTNRWIYAGLAAATVAGAVLRAIGLDGQLWFDEIVTLLNTVRIPLSTLVTSYTWDNQHTLYSVLAQASVAALGEHPWTLRLPSLVLGVASIPALYLVGRSLSGRGESLAAAALLAISYHPIWFSQNACGYTGLMLATLLATWCFVEGRRHGAWPWWAAYAAIVALGSYMHLTMVFVAVAHAMVVGGLVVGAVWRRRSVRFATRPALAIVVSGVLTIVLYAPMLRDLIRFHAEHQQFVASEWTRVDWAVAETVRGLQLGFGAALLAVAAAIAGVGGWHFLRRQPETFFLLVLPGVLGLVVMLFLGRHIWPRFFFYVFGFALLLGVQGASTLIGGLARRLAPANPQPVLRGLVGIAAAVLVVQSARSWRPLYSVPKQDLAGAMQFVEANRREGEPVVTVGLASMPYHRYYQTGWTEVDRGEQLDAILARGRRTWIVYTFPIHLHSRYPDVEQRISKRFQSPQVFPASVEGGEVRVATSLPNGEVIVNPSERASATDTSVGPGRNSW